MSAWTKEQFEDPERAPVACAKLRVLHVRKKLVGVLEQIDWLLQELDEADEAICEAQAGG
jgi:hypothetical protein